MTLSKEEQAFLKLFYQQVSLTKPLEPSSDNLYVPLYQEGEDAVGEDPVDLLARAIAWRPGESVHLLSGFKGTGKSTELRRLRDRLWTEGYYVVFLDMENYMNMTSPVDVSDFLVSIAGGVGDELLQPELLGTNPSVEGYWGRFANFMKSKLGLADISAAGVKVGLISTPTFRQRVQNDLAAHLGALYKDVCAFFEDCVKELRRQKGEQAELVVIVDSIDHIRGPLTNEDRVQASVEGLFSGHPSKLKIPYVHLVYTIPPYLRVRYPSLGGLYGVDTVPIFPAVKVHQRGDRESNDAGLRALRKVVMARGDALRLLGTEERLSRVIRMSGGHLRDLLRILGAILLRAQKLPVDADTVDAAINQLRLEMLPIANDDARWLAKIAMTHSASLEERGDLPTLAHFFDMGIVLYYRNGPEWYDVHPFVRDLVLEQAAPPSSKK